MTPRAPSGQPGTRQTAMHPVRRRLALSVAVLTAVTTAPIVTLSAATPASAGTLPPPVSGAFTMSGELSGDIDPRTGRFRTSFPLLKMDGPSGFATSLTLNYDQERAAAGTNRYGWGAGWGVSVPYVDPVGGLQIHPASGGSYGYDENSPSRLKNYMGEDLKFSQDSGVLPEREGVDGARPYHYTLEYTATGEAEYFGEDGNMIARADRFGNRMDMTWSTVEGGTGKPSFKPESVIDAYGQKTLFAEKPDGTHIVPPARSESSDERTPDTILSFDGGVLEWINLPGEQGSIHFRYNTYGPNQAKLLSQVFSPAGGVTQISYQNVPNQPGALAVETLKVTNDDDKELIPTRSFRFSPDGSARNFTGYPNFHGKGTDGLYESDDATAYSYTTELSDRYSAVRSTYNKFHLLKKSETLWVEGSRQGTSQEVELSYPGEVEGRAPRVADLKPNNAWAIQTDVTARNREGGQYKQTQKTTYNGLGLPSSTTDADGVTTTTEYGPYSQPVKTTTTAPGGPTKEVVNRLTSDGKSVESTTESVAEAGGPFSSRSTTSFAVDGRGELTRKTVTSTGDASTPPERAEEMYDREIGKDPITGGLRLTQTTTVDKGGPSEAKLVEVRDLSTNAVVEQRDAGGKVTRFDHDVAGRRIAETRFAGTDRSLTTSTTYSGVRERTVQTPDGRRVTHQTDELGRPTRMTDNVKGGKPVGADNARELRKVTYDVTGRVTETTSPGADKPTVETKDLAGRVVEVRRPNGVTQQTHYDDAASHEACATGVSSLTQYTIPAGSDREQAKITQKDSLDSEGRMVCSSTDYSDGTETPDSSRSFDGIGRDAGAVENDVEVTPIHGTGGLNEGNTLTPTATDRFPGTAITAKRDLNVLGESRSKSLTPADDPDRIRSGTRAVFDAAGRPERVTYPDGVYITYQYAADGQVKTATTTRSDGTVLSTTHNDYDEKTGRLTDTVITAEGIQPVKRHFEYNHTTGTVSHVWDPDNPEKTRISYEYNTDGYTTSITYPASPDHPDGAVLTQAFDDAGRLERTTDAAGLITAYGYYGHGAMREAVQYAADGTTRLASTRYFYDEMARPERVERENSTTHFTFWDSGQLKTQRTTGFEGAVLADASYTYDGHGQVASATETRPDPETGQSATTTTAYRYDAYNRLIKAQVHQGTSEQGAVLHSVEYPEINAAGDVVRTVTTSNGTTSVATNEIDDNGRLRTITTDGQSRAQEWSDERGNLTLDHQGNRYTYNAANQPVSVQSADGTTTEYQYWADGTRAASVTTGDAPAVTRFHYSPEGFLANDTHSNADGSDRSIGSYLMGPTSREARTLTEFGDDPSTTTDYFLVDRHGSVRGLTDNDGKLHTSYDYSPYGSPARSDGSALPPATPAQGAREQARVNPMGFGGEYRNHGTGSYHLSTRTYDPSQGRFTTADVEPLLNRFMAFDTNPIMKLDPSGGSAVWDAIVKAWEYAWYIPDKIMEGFNWVMEKVLTALPENVTDFLAEAFSKKEVQYTFIALEVASVIPFVGTAARTSSTVGKMTAKAASSVSKTTSKVAAKAKPASAASKAKEAKLDSKVASLSPQEKVKLAAKSPLEHAVKSRDEARNALAYYGLGVIAPAMVMNANSFAVESRGQGFLSETMEDRLTFMTMVSGFGSERAFDASSKARKKTKQSSHIEKSMNIEMEDANNWSKGSGGRESTVSNNLLSDR
ncbi:RHS repeat-associated core domain-containing protein [Kitasatospora sp. NPDC048540]|uniref:RHS repeat domain-containing protein n=1 Tax=Kitasatospora sp. NPDC048540 TaxID=3155634 RepID=UPI0033D4EFBD